MYNNRIVDCTGYQAVLPFNIAGTPVVLQTYKTIKLTFTTVNNRSSFEVRAKTKIETISKT